MDFARKQLEKYGWSDGKGLGKYETGMSEALKPKLKRSMAGIGHDAAADFTEHWWSALYDKAASNLEVKEKDGSTKKIKAKDSTGFEITNSTWKLSKKQKSESQEQYKDFFVRTAVLGSGGNKVERVRASEDEDEDVSDKNVVKMSDEELFAACGGRTAHKGARHGLKALGKLARIEQQEQMLLQQPQFSGYSHAKKLKEKGDDNEIVEEATIGCDVDTISSKKKKKKRKHCFTQENSENNLEVNAEDTKVKKKKHKKCLVEEIDSDSLDLGVVESLLQDTQIKNSDSGTIDGNEVTKKKKKKSKKEVQSDSEVISIDAKKPRKKRKHKDELETDCDMNNSSESKKKYNEKSKAS